MQYSFHRLDMWGCGCERVAEEVMVHNTVARIPVSWNYGYESERDGENNDAQYSCMGES